MELHPLVATAAREAAAAKDRLKRSEWIALQHVRSRQHDP